MDVGTKLMYKGSVYVDVFVSLESEAMNDFTNELQS